MSGGHFSPAVSLSVSLVGGMELLLLLLPPPPPPYVLAQMVGAIAAALTKVMHPSDVYAASLGGALNAAASDVGESTLILTTVACMGTVNRQSRTPWAPFWVGLTVAANVPAGWQVNNSEQNLRLSQQTGRCRCRMCEQSAEKMEMDGPDSSLMEKVKKPASKALSKYERLYQPCVAELVGTMLFVFVGCVSVIENGPAAGRLQPALVHGLAVAVLVAVMDKISGSHFNPPFTLAIYLCGGLELMMVGPYLLSQLIGAVLGAGMAKLVTSPERFHNATGAAFDVLKSESQLYRALLGEVAMTCMVTLVVLMVAVNSRTKTPLAPLLVGCTVTVNILAGADISGSCMNPARALGPALMTSYWTYHWVYWVGPIAGGVLGAALVRLILGDKQLRVVMKS
ncbi:LOW QUALITY PROTEIN: aquaporin-8-like [Anableps anableps]